MLGTSTIARTDPFAEELQSYLSDTLHDDIRVVQFEGRSRLPAFLEHTYKLYEASIAGRRCVFAAAGDEMQSPSDIAKHINLIRSEFQPAIVAYAAATLSAHNRSRLVKLRVPFVVPGNQLYMPDLAIDLREHYRAARPVAQALSPAAQAVLFDHLLRKDQSTALPSRIAGRLQYSAMSIGRAFDDLVTLGLAETETIGRMRQIHFKKDGRQLFEAARAYLRSPVRSVKHVKGGIDRSVLLLAGESALAELTDLSRPRMPTYALAASAWKAIKRERRLIEADAFDADLSIETWSYEPSALSSSTTVDPLSLYAQFRDHRDERVAGAAEQLLEDVAW